MRWGGLGFNLAIDVPRDHTRHAGFPQFSPLALGYTLLQQGGLVVVAVDAGASGATPNPEARLFAVIAPDGGGNCCW